MTNKPMLSVERELLKKWRRDLDACQRVIWLAGGFDPAYCKDAQDCLKEIDEALAKPAAQHQGEPVVYTQFLTDVMTAAGLVSHGKQDKKFAERLADECARLQVGQPAPAAVVHTMKSIMEAVEASCCYTVLTSDQCYALAQSMNGVNK